MLDSKDLLVERSIYVRVKMSISFLGSDYFWRPQALSTNHRLKCLLLQKTKKKDLSRDDNEIKKMLLNLHPYIRADSLHFYTLCFVLQHAFSIDPQFSDLLAFLVCHIWSLALTSDHTSSQKEIF